MKFGIGLFYTFLVGRIRMNGSDLPGCSVVSEEIEHGCEPVVNFIQSALIVRRLQDRLQTVRQ